jgi:EKC/KEOPS complex subunit PCC1/LAGE3
LTLTSTINTPFPTRRLAETTLKSLAVDEELSPLVRRSFSLVNTAGEDVGNDEDKTVLRTEYKATTNRMLRVAVNGFFESLNVVVQVMEELDVDVLHEKGLEDLQGVQGVEQGMIGTTVAGT